MTSQTEHHREWAKLAVKACEETGDILSRETYSLAGVDAPKEAIDELQRREVIARRERIREIDREGARRARSVLRKTMWERGYEVDGKRAPRWIRWRASMRRAVGRR